VINLEYKRLAVPFGRLSADSAQVGKDPQGEDVPLKPLTVDPARALPEHPLDRSSTNQHRIRPAVTPGKFQARLCRGPMYAGYCIAI